MPKTRVLVKDGRLAKHIYPKGVMLDEETTLTFNFWLYPVGEAPVQPAAICVDASENGINWVELYEGGMDTDHRTDEFVVEGVWKHYRIRSEELGENNYFRATVTLP